MATERIEFVMDEVEPYKLSEMFSLIREFDGS